MPKRGEAAHPAVKPPKRKKGASGGQTVTWSDLSYDLVWEIFNHVSTVRKSTYRRVSSGWNDVLSNHLSSSPVANLKLCDFKDWKIFLSGPPERQSRLQTNVRKVKLLTDTTRWLILDFQDTIISAYSIWTTFQLEAEQEQQPLQELLEAFPHISQMVLYRMLMEEHSCFVSRMSDYRCFKTLGCSSTSSLLQGVTTTIYKSALANPVPLELKLGAGMDWAMMNSWKVLWPKVKLKLEGDGKGYWLPLTELYMTSWPYPPAHLAWLEDCLNRVPAYDAVHGMLRDEYNTCDHEEKSFAEKAGIPFRGKRYLGDILDVCARYLTTYRQNLDLPPPPHPLVWNT